MAQAALALLRSSAGPSFLPILCTLENAAESHADLVTTLASQLLAALQAPLKNEPAAPLLPNLDECRVKFPSLAFFSPRGTGLLLSLSPSDLVLTDKKGALVLSCPLDAFETLLLLPRPAEGKKVVLPLVLAAFKAGREPLVGKARLPVVLFACPPGELRLPHPVDGQPELTGAAHDVLAAALSAATKVGVEPPSQFRSSRGTPFFAAHLKVAPGLIHPLRSGIAFVTSAKPTWAPCRSWDGVSIGRAGGLGSTFDFVVGDDEFGMIDRAELPALQEYIEQRTRAMAKSAAKSAAAAAAAAAPAATTGAEAAAAAAPDAAGAAEEADADDDDSSDSDDTDFKAGGSGSDDDGDGSSSSDGDGGSGEDDASDGGKKADGGAATTKGDGDHAGGGLKRGRENDAPATAFAPRCGAGSDSEADDAGRWGVVKAKAA